MTAPELLPWRCICGRGFAKRFGLHVHERTCPKERARSEAWVRAIEEGRNPHDDPAAAIQ